MWIMVLPFIFVSYVQCESLNRLDLSENHDNIVIAIIEIKFLIKFHSHYEWVLEFASNHRHEKQSDRE